MSGAVSAWAAAGAVLAAPAVGSAAVTPPRAALTAIACRSDLDPALRRVSVVSVMRHVPGTRTLQVRFRLLATAPGQAPAAITGGDLGHWLSPAVPTLGRNAADVWRLAKSVYGVAAPASYRFVVGFRWLGAGGRVLAHRSLSTGSCAVRELRPDVLVRSVAVRAVAGAPSQDRYVATIANRGATASGRFSVLFAPGSGAATQTKPVASLAPRAHERVAFNGPACNAAAPPTIIADPGDQVDDDDRANNTFTVSCPGAPAGGERADGGH